ncbi:flagellar protein FlgN [Bradyrhizobium diazoefficiens]|nr:flagellar protein FlgN [Bradyrhizobium diazoefficiens]MBR0963487.1 flagellar protein FlgN [Bradyrhizobium diazoefficiens]MBR0976300.1 flagellar protein FlgN [Bradyrhizobium diazoefficiens]MBR1007148.1 flagellar protein FlgN [Bradyrhizobium diazoefficiens]MBR1013260.1 flagellar protein FlgN [Bradyrhizobium diazoefficiens]MBR1050079.1 flagellar protein FlgN [Bradyrhizobium diazoefficiens]
MTMTVAQANSQATRTTVASGDIRIKSLITLIDTLTVLVAEENAELARGLPASRLKQVDEKNKLAEIFERTVAECAAGSTSLNVRDRMLREQLLERILKLRAAMDENLVRLRAAIEASNRRIEAVMQAIREQIASVSPYGASGRVAAARAVSSGTSRSA